MHCNFVDLREALFNEQRRSHEMQQKVFDMIKEVQQIVLTEAENSARNLGKMSSKMSQFHDRWGWLAKYYN